jgi:hypothetical protein
MADLLPMVGIVGDSTVAREWEHHREVPPVRARMLSSHRPHRRKYHNLRDGPVLLLFSVPTRWSSYLYSDSRDCLVREPRVVVSHRDGQRSDLCHGLGVPPYLDNQLRSGPVVGHLPVDVQEHGPDVRVVPFPGSLVK